MISIQEARTRVQRGAAHLDVVRPGWENQIDVGTLTLHDSCGCIVGQLCKTGQAFQAGLDRLQVSDPEMFGMERPTVVWASGMTYPAHERLCAQQYRQLQDVWIEEIANRRLAHAPHTEIVSAGSDVSEEQPVSMRV